MDHYAKEARRLLDDDVLTKAFDDVRQGALEALAMADAGNLTMILRLQAQATVIDEVRSVLSAMIIRQGPPDDKASPFA